MELAATLDPERLREIMHELFNRSAEVVQRYQGTVDKFTGDGLMALFGAPVALEDHALRACITALEIQSLARGLAADVLRRDEVDLQIRIGVNSGEVIAGEIGVGPGSYTAVGHPVGMAQRMEAAAPPGGVMCAATTARLVERSALLGPLEWVAVKGSAEPVPARRLEGVESDRAMLGRDDGPLMGRDADLAALLSAFDGGAVSVVSVVGEPGLGKSRLLREFASHAKTAGAEIVLTRCEAHTANVPLHALSRTLRVMFGIRRLDAAAAREHVAAQLKDVTEADSVDSGILFDLLSIGDPDATASTIGPDVRRRRLVETLGKVAENRRVRTLYIVEDVHWVDEASEEILAKFAATLAGTQSMFVSSLRPEYHGTIRENSQTTITLTPLNDATTLALAAELIGRHPAAQGVAPRIALPSGGNPFFVEEIVRDLVGRGLLVGNRGDYRLVGDVDAIAVPTTVQSVLAARIDRLSKPEKSILSAGSVIGSAFDVDILEVLLPSVESHHLRSLISAELIDQIQLLPEPRYAFRHPLVRAVSYETQLRTTRADGHARLAAAIEARNPAAVEENSALIAQHLDAAGELGAAYAWYMRSGEWLMHRDVNGARGSWERAREIADGLPDDEEGVISNRIAPRALLTFTGWKVGSTLDSVRWFDDLRQLATQSGDLLSLAKGISGRLDSMVVGERRIREGLAMASELLELVDKVNGTPAEMAEMLLTIAVAQYAGCEFAQAVHTLDRLREMAAELTGCELAPACCIAGVIKIITGEREEGRRDLDEGLRLSRADHPLTRSIAVGWNTDLVVLGFELADEALLQEAPDALRMAESIGDASALDLARWAYGTALLRSDDTHYGAGVDLIRQSRAGFLNNFVGTWCDAELAGEMARHGSSDDAAIGALQSAVQSGIDMGDKFFVGYPTAVLVRLLTLRGGATDAQEARDVVARFEAELPPDPEPALQLWPLQCRALLASAVGDRVGYSHIVIRYRELAEEVDARGHLATARQLEADSDLLP
jgi:adenylate cyclase